MSKWSAAHGREKRSMLCHVSPVHIPSHNPNLSENEVHFKNSRRRRRDFGVSWSVLSWASLCSERANLWVKRLIFWILEGCSLCAVAANFLLAVKKKKKGAFASQKEICEDNGPEVEARLHNCSSVQESQAQVFFLFPLLLSLKWFHVGECSHPSAPFMSHILCCGRP